MPSKAQFRKQILSQYIQNNSAGNDINKWVCAGVFVSIMGIPNVYAVETVTDNEMLEPASSPQAVENNKEKLEQVANAQGVPQDKIDQLEQKLAQQTNENQVDSYAMLQAQEQDLNNADFRPIELEDLEALPSTKLDSALANEIYAVAEEAKREAQNYRAGQASDPQLDIPELKQEDALTAEISQAPVDVDQLMQSIQSDSQIAVTENEGGRSLGDPSLSVNQEPANAKKPNIFKRLFYRVRPPRLNQPTAVPRITADVNGAPKPLADNIKAKLSAFTVESYADFNSAIPQLRTMSQQAAQAVGYYDAEFAFQKVSDNRVQVTVKPNQPVLVREQNIEFTGPGQRLAQLQVIPVLPDLEVGDIFHQGKYETTKKRINDAAYNNGFFDAYWRLHDVKLERPQNQADINLKFETGERYKLDRVQFRMSDPNKKLPIREEILRTLAPWDESADYTAWRVNLLANNLTNSRYFNYSLVDAVRPDPIEKPLELPPDLQRLVDEQRLDPALFDGSKAPKPVSPESAQNRARTSSLTDEAQFAGTQPSDQADTQKATSQAEEKERENNRLQALAREQKKIPVIVTLNADKLNSLEAGIGYGTDTGIRLRSQYRRSIVNDRGHSFDANLELSEMRQSIDGRYNIPYKHPLNDYISLVGGYEREDRDSIGNGLNLIVESAVAGVDRIIKGSRRDWQHIFGLRYRLDRMTIEGEIPDTLDPDTNWDEIPDFVSATGNTEQQSLLLGYEATKVNSNNRLNPTRGFKQNYKIQLGSKSLLSDVDMAIVNTNWKFLYSLGQNDNHQLLGGASLGYIFTEDFQKVPYNLRFFEGGDQSLRGFDYKSLSPIEYGYKVGGQARAIGTFEYNYQFRDGWRAALFSDFGNAYDEKFNNDTEYSIGAGIRWNSPIGPIRLDVASGISSPDKPIRLHFFIGPQL